jgi:hypothetical protein
MRHISYVREIEKEKTQGDFLGKRERERENEKETMRENEKERKREK